MVLSSFNFLIKRTKYGLYLEAVLLCKSCDENKWKQAKFMVFDVPSIEKNPYEV
jgi:hypothetical protein